MGKILTYSEIPDKKHHIYSEEYEVNFWYQGEDGFWKKDKIIYYSENKGENDKVRKRWETDNKEKNTKLINIIYQ